MTSAGVEAGKNLARYSEDAAPEPQTRESPIRVKCTFRLMALTAVGHCYIQAPEAARLGD
jgi:hypothetical protein